MYNMLKKFENIF